jgi:hypothetical protein
VSRFNFELVVEAVRRLDDGVGDAGIFLEIGDVLPQCLAALVQERDELGAGLAEGGGGDLRLAGAVAIGGEAVGDLQQRVVGALDLVRVDSEFSEELLRPGVAGLRLRQLDIQSLDAFR